MRKLQGLWVTLLLLSAWAGAPGAETVPAVDGEKAQAAAATESVLYFPDFVDGGGWSVQLVLNNVDPNRSAPVEVEVYGQQGRMVPRFFGSGNRFEIPAQGSRVLRSPGGRSVRRGWIKVEADSAPVHGLLTYRHAESGIEVGVRPVPLNDHFALYVEESSDIGTGLAIFKPDAATGIEFQLRNEAGLDPLGRVLTQRNFQQRANVLPEWFAGAGTGFLENFRGLLFLRSADGSGFAPMGLRGGKRKGSLSAVPLIPISGDGGDNRPPNPFQPDDAPAGGETLYFPDFVDGGGWSVQLVLNNIDLTRSAPVEVEVYDQQGRPVPAFFDFGNRFEIPAGGSRVLRSPGGRSVQRGWIEVETDSASVHGLLTYRHAESGIEVGVEAVPLSDHFALYVEESRDIGTGLAIFKPDAASEIEFQFRDEAGLDPLGEVVTQGNFQQRAHVLPDWFAGVDTGFLEDFRGLLFLRVADSSGFAPMGLRGGKRQGSLSAVPVIPILGEGGGKIYWTDDGIGNIQRANLDGTGVQTLVTGLSNPRGLDLNISSSKMYWTAYDRGGKIQRANLDGTGVEDLVTGLSSVEALVLDTVTGKIYWTDRGRDKIQRANLDGSAVDDFVTGIPEPVGLALDPGAGKIYWSDLGTDKIQRANLDGSGVEDLITTGLVAPFGLAIDLGVSKIYWADWGASKIGRANLNGTGVEDLVTGVNTPYALGVGDEKIYWTQSHGGKIQRANLDGTQVEDLVTGLGGPLGLALDLGDRDPGGGSPPPDLVVVSPSVSDDTLTAGQSFELRVTVRNQGAGRAVAATLRYYRSNNPTISLRDTPVGTDAISALAASGAIAESIRLTAPSSTGTYYYGACVDSVSGEGLTGNNCSAGVQVTVNAGGSTASTPKIYWTDTEPGKIQLANLDGSGVQDLVTGLRAPRGLALDEIGGKIYWADSRDGKIQRANLDGSGVQDLVTGLDTPGWIALDPGGGKIYWTDWRRDKIQRANLDGSGVQDLITGLNRPRDVDLDPGGGKIYWAESWGRQIQRANLDGSGVEGLITGLDDPFGLALDVGAGKIYWSDWATPKIQRANLDGSGVEDLITGLNSPRGVTLDPGAGKIYWTDVGEDKIQRANLDGTGVEDLVTGLNGPVGIALDQGGGKAAADVVRFLGENPRIAAAMLWLGADNQLKPYAEWPQGLKDKLALAVDQLLVSGTTGLPEVMANQAADFLGDDDLVKTILSIEDAEDLYVANVAQSLILEMTGTLRWSLADLSEHELELLLSSKVYGAQDGPWIVQQSGFYLHYGSFAAVTGYHVDTKGILPAPPELIRDFMAAEDLVGDSRYETIIRTINWARYHLTHYSGGRSAKNFENHWDYRGAPPLARILAGTTHKEGGSSRYFTAGCHGTNWFLIHLLRAVNIPVQYVYWSGHAIPSFPSEALYLSHGDDPYVTTGQYSPPFPEPYPTSEVPISEATYREWFSTSNSREENRNNVGRRTTELAVEHLPQTLLLARCRDRDQGLSNAESYVYSPGAFGIGRHWTVAELEAMRFWERMDAKIEQYGGCSMIPSPTRPHATQGGTP